MSETMSSEESDFDRAVMLDEPDGYGESCECSDEPEDDRFFEDFESCDTEGCIMPSGHFASDCHTAEDLENYYSQMEKEA